MKTIVGISQEIFEIFTFILPFDLAIHIEKSILQKISKYKTFTNYH